MLLWGPLIRGSTALFKVDAQYIFIISSAVQYSCSNECLLYIQFVFSSMRRPNWFDAYKMLSCIFNIPLSLFNNSGHRYAEISTHFWTDFSFQLCFTSSRLRWAISERPTLSTKKKKTSLNVCQLLQRWTMFTRK